MSLQKFPKTIDVPAESAMAVSGNARVIQELVDLVPPDDLKRIRNWAKGKATAQISELIKLLP